MKIFLRCERSKLWVGPNQPLMLELKANQPTMVLFSYSYPLPTANMYAKTQVWTLLYKQIITLEVIQVQSNLSFFYVGTI